MQRRLGAIRFGVYAAAGLPLPLTSRGVGLALIEDAPTPTYPDVGWLRQRLPEAQVVLRANSRTSQALMCAQGVGLAVLPRIVGDRLPGLIPIDLGAESPSRDIWMEFHQDLRTLQRLREFITITTRDLAGEQVPARARCLVRQCCRVHRSVRSPTHGGDHGIEEDACLARHGAMVGKEGLNRRLAANANPASLAPEFPTVGPRRRRRGISKRLPARPCTGGGWHRRCRRTTGPVPERTPRDQPDRSAATVRTYRRSGAARD